MFVKIYCIPFFYGNGHQQGEKIWSDYDGEELLILVMLEDKIPAGAKLY